MNTVNQYYRLLKETGNLVIINNPHNLFKTSHYFQKFHLRNGVALIKKGTLRPAYHFGMHHNYCWILSKTEKGIKEKWNGTKENHDKDFYEDVFEYQNAYRDKNGFHPQAIPEWLVEIFVELLSDEGDLILDPFFGSGTTGVVAKKLDRNYIGIEIKKEYVDMARNRINRINRTLDEYCGD